jgi:glycosyltransferase involved in cell wall biosynthesis
MAMLEAMLYGLPVVATAVGGIPDIIKSGRNGILVRPGNARDISEAVCLLFKDQKLRDQIGTEARVTVQTKYNVKNWIKKMEDEYRKVVAG